MSLNVKLPAEVLLDLGTKIRPLVERPQSGLLCYGMGDIALCQPFNLQSGDPVRGLVSMGSVITLHAPHQPYSRGFQATVAEVLSQAPAEVLKKASAFVLRQTPHQKATSFPGEHQLATATFFEGELPASVRKQAVTLG